MAGRREQVLDAAVEVLGTEGTRRLTYQAVDSAAGVPGGTTSNYFRNRDALISGVVAHLEALDRLDWESLAGARPPGDVDQLTAALTGFVMRAVGPARSRTAARYALFLEAISRPELRDWLARGQAAIVDWAAQAIQELGSPTPHEHCRLLLHYLDGLILHQTVLSDPEFDPAPGIRTVLGGFVGR